MLLMLLDTAGFLLLAMRNCYGIAKVYERVAIVLMVMTTILWMGLLAFVKCHMHDAQEKKESSLRALRENNPEVYPENVDVLRVSTTCDTVFVVATSILLFFCAAERYISSEKALSVLFDTETAIAGSMVFVWMGYIAFRTLYWAIGTCFACAIQDPLLGEKEQCVLEEIAIGLRESQCYARLCPRG